MSAIPPPTPEKAALLMLNGFRVDAHELPPRHRAVLRAFAERVGVILRRYPGAKTTFTFTGHTDTTGSETHNTALGLRRALEVSRTMQDLIPQDVGRRVRYVTRSGGESTPARAERTPRNRAHNRRVEIRARSELPPPSPAPPLVPRGPLHLRPLPPPCWDLEMMAWFQLEHRQLRELLSLTVLRWPGSGSKIVLDVDEKPQGKVSSLADEVLKSMLDLARSPGDDAILGEASAVIGFLEMGAMVEEDRRNERIMGDPAGPEAQRRHRQLVAEKVAKTTHSNWMKERERLLYFWERYERLAADCYRLRPDTPKGPTIKAGPRARPSSVTN
jgi:hypothetical protein